MDNLSRRSFLKMAGVGSAGLAAMGAGAAAVGRLLGFGTAGASSPATPTHLSFRATAGLPQRPYPAYASLVVQGSIDPGLGTGTLQRSVFAGAPDVQSGILLPGTQRFYNVTDVTGDGGSLLLRAIVTDPAAIDPGESRTILVRVDRRNGVVRAPFGSKDMELRLAG